MFIILNIPLFAKKQDDLLWYHANDLADRLKAERWKLRKVRGEIKRLEQVVKDLENVRLYPSSVTKLFAGETQKTAKKLQKIISRSNRYSEILEDLEKPMADALIIAEEMLKEIPNKDMMDLLVADNVERIQNLVKVKKRVDLLWDGVSSVMREYEKIAGIKRKVKEKGLIEEMFFKVLISQIGQASDKFYKDFHDYKDSLVIRGNKKDWTMMAKIDLQSLKGGYNTLTLMARQRDLKRLSSRYQGKIPIGGISYHLASNYMETKNYEKAIITFQKVGEGSSFYLNSQLGVARSLFQLKEDSLLIAHIERMNTRIKFNQKQLNAIRFLQIQSLYQLGKDKDVEKTILSYESKDKYYFKSLKIYIQSLIRKERLSEASEILKSVIKQVQLDKRYRTDARLTLAFLKFEQTFYKSALVDFQKLLDLDGYQAASLYGLVWCYVKMNNLKTAEFSLKQLINQYPDDPLAINALLILSKWRFIKAQKLWAYKKCTELNKALLARYQRSLNTMRKTNQIPPGQFDEIQKKLDRSALTISYRVPVTMYDIESLFQEALTLSDYVLTHYNTGQFSAMKFQGARERALSKLQDLAREDKTKRKSESQSIEPELLSDKLYKSNLLKFDITWRYKAWLEEYLSFLGHEDIQNEILLKTQPNQNDSTIQLTKESIVLLKSRVAEKILVFRANIKTHLEDLLSNPLSVQNRDHFLFYQGLVNFELAESRINMLKTRTNRLDSLYEKAGVSLEVDTDKGFQNTDFEKSWSNLLQDYPDSKYRPYTMYFLGYSQVVQDDPRGLGLLEDYIEKYPNHKYKQHALTVTGDYYYEHQNFKKARKYFTKILRIPESEYFNKALYMQAWIYYNTAKYNLAMDAFRFLLRDVTSANEDKIGTPMVEEILKMMAISFAEKDTSESLDDRELKSFIKQFTRQRVMVRVLHKTGLVYRQQGRLQKARRVFHSIIKKFPWYEDMPTVLMDLAISYDVENNFQKAANIRNRVFNDYNRKSPWYADLSKPKARFRADSLCEEALNKIAFHYFALAKLNPANRGRRPVSDSIYNKAAYMKAIEAYERFLEVYPDGPRAANAYYQLAESYFAIREYVKASKMYIKASHQGGASLRTAAAYNAVMSARQIVDTK